MMLCLELVYHKNICLSLFKMLANQIEYTWHKLRSVQSWNTIYSVYYIIELGHWPNE